MESTKNKTTTTESWHRDGWRAEIDAVSFMRAIREKKIIIRRNKWRPDHGLNFENHKITGYIGSGGFGSVSEVINTATNQRFALKLQYNLQKYDPSKIYPQGARSPPLTPTSEATKSSSLSVEQRSLRAKRNQETRVYLRHIRTGHPHICNLEAFVQYTPVHDDEERPALGLYFEYCDVGSMDNLTGEFMSHKSKPPELFIWQCFYELSSGLAFLHNEHPDYNTRSEHKGRVVIFQDDMHEGNVFLQWGPDREGGYPHIKIGDFGVSSVEPRGGFASDPGYVEPETRKGKKLVPVVTRLKKEVYNMAVVIYELAHIGKAVDDFDDFDLEEKREKYKKLEPIDSYLSETLDRLIRGTMTPEIEDRPFSGELYLLTKSAFEERVGIMYRQLPDWVGAKTVTHPFDEKRMKELDEGALETELLASKRWGIINARATQLINDYLEDLGNDDDDDDENNDEIYEEMHREFVEQATREFEEKARRIIKMRDEGAS
ncbi:hypothetical protein SBOR_7206 [Sclerotinia borealis F-4128]|uniref:non-specific serine/threonine protein kinase n=1 Tax=Sclerotinia borealis (strain F-4128) TaxID=1432307 RepID=W9C9D1_SCLBF|nr:hypothetical protein SBOR_7206 [Sclerotinia borealis F-4128]